MTRLTRVAAPLLAVALAAGCTGSSDNPTVGPPGHTSSPSGTPSDAPANALPAALGAGHLSGWRGCGGGFRCATLTVPLDPAKPALGTVALAVTRHSATGLHRIGALITNPGGPGESAVEWVKNAYEELPAEIRARFDVVAFDPRGVGLTSPVRCLSTPQLDDYFHLDPAPTTAAGKAALLSGQQELDAGCARRSGRILPYVGTAVVAQDLERLRQALGDPKLTYLGYSYGTAIGAAYLDQFPTHVRAMVLDGALDPRMSWDQFLAGQSQGFDGALHAFLQNCEQIRCSFRQAVSGDLTAAFDALAHRVKAHPLPGDRSPRVGPDEFTLGVGAGLYSKSYGWPAISDALAAAESGDGSSLLALNDSYLERTARGYSNLSESNFAVNCIDRPWPRTEAPYYALAQQVATTAPRFGPAIALSGLGCIAWPVAPTGRPHAVTAPGSPAVVVIGTTRDPATPYAWARSLASQLSHGVLLTHIGDGHTVYRVGAPACIVRPVDAYLLTLAVPTARTC